MKILLPLSVLLSTLLFNSNVYACASCIDFYSCNIEKTGTLISVTGNWTFVDVSNENTNSAIQLDRLQVVYGSTSDTIYRLDSISDGFRNQIKQSSNFSFTAVHPNGTAVHISRFNETGKLFFIANGKVNEHKLVSCKDIQNKY